MNIKLVSIILQILGFAILAGAVSILTFVAPGAFRGFEGWINNLLRYVGLSGYVGTKRRQKLIYWLIGLAVLFGCGGLVLELFVE